MWSVMPSCTMPVEHPLIRCIMRRYDRSRVIDYTGRSQIQVHAHGPLNFNALLRVTISLAHVTLNAGYFSPGTCIATSWTVFSTLLLLWPQPHFKQTGKTLPTLRKKLHARQAVEKREEEGCVFSIPLSDLIGKLLELKYIRSTRAHPYDRLSL